MKLKNAYLCVNCDEIFDTQGWVPTDCKFCGSKVIMSMDKLLNKREEVIKDEDVKNVEASREEAEGNSEASQR